VGPTNESSPIQQAHGCARPWAGAPWTMISRALGWHGLRVGERQQMLERRRVSRTARRTVTPTRSAGSAATCHSAGRPSPPKNWPAKSGLDRRRIRRYRIEAGPGARERSCWQKRWISSPPGVGGHRRTRHFDGVGGARTQRFRLELPLEPTAFFQRISYPIPKDT
jgi:hypothetical protein